MHEAAQPHTLFAWVILFPAVMVAVWLFSTTVTSYLGGWHALSLRFQTLESSAGSGGTTRAARCAPSPTTTAA